jgi:hypothetical protein
MNCLGVKPTLTFSRHDSLQGLHGPGTVLRAGEADEGACASEPLVALPAKWHAGAKGWRQKRRLALAKSILTEMTHRQKEGMHVPFRLRLSTCSHWVLRIIA